MGPETRYALSGDVHIAYQVIGDGPFDLVLVPGFVTHMELQWRLIQSLLPVGNVEVIVRLAGWSRRHVDRGPGAALVPYRPSVVRGSRPMKAARRSQSSASGAGETSAPKGAPGPAMLRY
jgi:hypothetical protein